METLKSGILAYYDSFVGMLPCKVLQIDRGRIIKIRFTTNRLPYHKGETMWASSLHVAPRKSVKFRKFSTTIQPFLTEVDA